MSGAIDRDAEAVHPPLEADGEKVYMSLSRETAELVARAVDARARGQQVLITRDSAEVSPNEAADLLSMSRPRVRKLMDQGALECRGRDECALHCEHQVSGPDDHRPCDLGSAAARSD